MSAKQPQTWSEFKAEHAKSFACTCGDPVCSANVGLGCPRCGRQLTLAIHNNAPTIILGCTPCGESFAYLRLVP